MYAVRVLSDEQSFLLKTLFEWSYLICSLATLIQEMNSDDPVVQEKAILKTEKRLLLTEEDQEEDGCRTALNKTMISPPQAPAKVPFSYCELT